MAVLAAQPGGARLAAGHLAAHRLLLGGPCCLIGLPVRGTIGLELAQRFAHARSTAPPISPPARQFVTAAVAELVVLGGVDLLRLLEDLRGQLAARLVRRGRRVSGHLRAVDGDQPDINEPGLIA